MKRNYYLVFLVFITFFAISFLTNILGAIIPEAKDDFHVSYAMAAFLPLFFHEALYSASTKNIFKSALYSASTK